MLNDPKQSVGALDATIFQHPLLRRLVELATVGGRRLLFVYPTETGWKQTSAVANEPESPAFCKMFQQSAEGAKRCKTCHVLMTVAACNGGALEQRCHAGSLVMVSPVAAGSSEAFAVLSSCIFADQKGWAEARKRGKELGLDLVQLRKAYYQLPKLRNEQRQVFQKAMEAIGCAIELIRQKNELETRLRQPAPAAQLPGADFRRYLESTGWARGLDHPKGVHDAKAPMMIRVIRELVRQRPDLPLTVKELAVAARLTPNHLTTSFRDCTGQAFTDYLLEQRMVRAKKLLCDLTLNIAEVARQVGYEDTCYFARRFRKATKLSPRDWRNRHSLDRGAKQ